MLDTPVRTLPSRRNWWAAIPLLSLALSLALTACASSSSSGPPTSPPASRSSTPPSDSPGAFQTSLPSRHSSAATKATASTPARETAAHGGLASSDTPAAPATYHVAADIKDGGYSYSIDATLSLGTPTDGDSTQLPPGLDAIDLPLSGNVTVSNTTPGRAAPGLEQAKIQLFGLWRLPSVICPGEEHDLSGNLGINYPVIGGKSYCGLPLADIGILGYLGPGDTGSGPPQPLYCLSTCPDYITYQFDHDDVSAVEAQLDKPDYVILGLEQTYSAMNSLGDQFCATSSFYILAADPQLPLNHCR